MAPLARYFAPAHILAHSCTFIPPHPDTSPKHLGSVCAFILNHPELFWWLNNASVHWKPLNTGCQKHLVADRGAQLCPQFLLHPSAPCTLNCSGCTTTPGSSIASPCLGEQLRMLSPMSSEPEGEHLYSSAHQCILVTPCEYKYSPTAK